MSSTPEDLNNLINNHGWKNFLIKNEINDQKVIILGDFFIQCFILSNIFIKDFEFDDSAPSGSAYKTKIKIKR